MEGVRTILGQSAFLAGFYSYPEYSPFIPSAKIEPPCQTMTVAALPEVQYHG